MSPRPVPLTATVLLTAASSSFFLTGCGEGSVSSTPTQTTTTTSVSADTAPPVPDIEEPTTSSPTPKPQSKCCWTAWGNHYDCANFPEGGNGGLCNNDITTACNGNSDCSDLDPPSTTPAPPPTPTTTLTTTTTTMPEGACLSTEQHGCFNGQPYMNAEHFVCGKGANIDIYAWGTNACCAQGTIYDPHTEFCCAGAINSHSDGQCTEYEPNNDPAGCRCPSSSNEVIDPTEVVGAVDTVIINTKDWRNPVQNPCLGAEGTMGCLNGFLFDPSTDTLCGNYIVKGDTHGCCPTNSGIRVYNLATETCCQFQDGDVRPGTHQCQCREWPNPHCSGALFSTVV